MLKKVFNRCRRAIKEPGLNFIYNFLMSPAKNFQGRKLFDANELRNLHRALLNQNLFGIDGSMVPSFETEFATAYGVPYAVASTSGTAAIHTALGALDLNPGDEIITAPITDMGTIVPILYQQSIPIFADTNETYNMDPFDVERKITSRTKAILVVHLFGNPCDMDAMLTIARKHKVVLIEDCAQAHMTEYKGRYVGTIGDIGCFSFQQSKHMTTGDGGMTVTSNKAYYEKMKLFIDKGYARKGWGSRAYLFLAPNYRMNELTAAVGLAQLKKVKDVVIKKEELGEYLSELISDIKDLVPAPITQGAKGSYWLYPLYLKNINIEDFCIEMRKEQIWVGAGYTGKPIYLCTESLTAKKTFGNSQFPFSAKITDKVYEYKEGLCPRAEDALKHLILIHLSETLTRKDLERYARAIKICVERLSGGSLKTVTAPKIMEAATTLVANSQEKEIRIGIIGCGQMGSLHRKSYLENSKAKLVAFADTEISRAKSFIRNTREKAYTDYRQMIHNEKLDGVSVCTIPSTHKKIVIDLLNAGVNVLCEKPLAVSTNQAKEMTRKADEKGLLLLTAFKFRFYEEVSKLKELIEKGSLGDIINFRLMFGGYMDMAGTWYSKKELAGGGIIMDNAPHAIDLIRYLFGEIETISAQKKNYQNLEVEDTAKITLNLKNGITGTMDLSWSINIASRNYLEIYGQEGAAMLYSGGISYKFKTWNSWKSIPNKMSIPEKIFGRQIDHFLEAIISKITSVTNNEDGLKSQRVIEAAYKSIEDKSIVCVV